MCNNAFNVITDIEQNIIFSSNKGTTYYTSLDIICMAKGNFPVEITFKCTFDGSRKGSLK